MSNETVRFFNAAFDERDGDILLRGSIDPESLQKLHVDDYQREILPRKGSLTYWTEQLRRGFIPRHRRRHEGRCVFSRTGSTAWFFPLGSGCGWKRVPADWSGARVRPSSNGRARKLGETGYKRYTKRPRRRSRRQLGEK